MTKYSNNEKELLNYITNNDLEGFLKWSLVSPDDELKRDVYSVDFYAMVKKHNKEITNHIDYLNYKVSQMFIIASKHGIDTSMLLNK